MRIAKGLLKIMMLPVVMILGIVSALGNTFMKVVCYVLGPIMLILAGCVLYGFLTQTWYNVGIALGCEVLCGAILFVGAFVMAEADILKDYLLHL